MYYSTYHMYVQSMYMLLHMSYNVTIVLCCKIGVVARDPGQLC